MIASFRLILRSVSEHFWAISPLEYPCIFISAIMTKTGSGNKPNNRWCSSTKSISKSGPICAASITSRPLGERGSVDWKTESPRTFPPPLLAAANSLCKSITRLPVMRTSSFHKPSSFSIFLKMVRSTFSQRRLKTLNATSSSSEIRFSVWANFDRAIQRSAMTCHPFPQPDQQTRPLTDVSGCGRVLIPMFRCS